MTGEKFYLLINKAAVYIKAGSFFEETLLKNEPAKAAAWEMVYAPNMGEARQIGIAIRRWRWPDANVTLNEATTDPREPRTIWEKAEASASEMRRSNKPALDMLKQVTADHLLELSQRMSDVAAAVGCELAVPTRGEITKRLAEVIAEELDENDD